MLTSAWLVEQGYSLDLQKRYKKSLWFDSIGTGALIRRGDTVDYLGGVYALQTQLGLSGWAEGDLSMFQQQANPLPKKLLRKRMFLFF